jgi:hypothetical protein
MAEDTTREFVDRAIRERLERPENLAELLADTVPEIAAHLDFTQMRPAPRESWATSGNANRICCSKYPIARRTKQRQR